MAVMMTKVISMLVLLGVLLMGINYVLQTPADDACVRTRHGSVFAVVYGLVITYIATLACVAAL